MLVWETQTTNGKRYLIFLERHDVPRGYDYLISNSDADVSIVGEYLLVDGDGLIRTHYQKPQLSVDCENLYVHYVYRVTEGSLERIDICNSDGHVEVKRGMVLEGLARVPAEQVPDAVVSAPRRFNVLDGVCKYALHSTEDFHHSWQPVSRTN